MKIIVTIIPTDLVKISFYSLLVLFNKRKTRIRFSASWWSGNEKYFCFLFVASRALLQRHAELNRLSHVILLHGFFLHVIPVPIIVPWED